MSGGSQDEPEPTPPDTTSGETRSLAERAEEALGPGRWVPIARAVDMLGIPPKSLYRYAKQGRYCMRELDIGKRRPQMQIYVTDEEIERRAGFQEYLQTIPDATRRHQAPPMPGAQADATPQGAPLPITPVGRTRVEILALLEHLKHLETQVVEAREKLAEAEVKLAEAEGRERTATGLLAKEVETARAEQAALSARHEKLEQDLLEHRVGPPRYQGPWYAQREFRYLAIAGLILILAVLLARWLS